MELSPKIKKMMLSLPVERLLKSTSTQHGHESSQDLGNESDFNEYKNYTAGDEVKRMDWKIFARMEKYYIKRYSSDKSREIYLIFDCSLSMNDDVSQHYFTTFSLLINYLFLKEEKYGLILLKDSNSEFYAAGSGSRHLKKTEQVLADITFEGKSHFHHELIRMIQKIPDQSEIIFFSDFQNEIIEFHPVIEITRTKNIFGFFVCCFNPNLLKFNLPNSDQWLEDQETKQKVYFSKELMKDYEKMIFDHYQELKKYFNRKNFRFQELKHQSEDWENFLTLFS